MSSNEQEAIRQALEAGRLTVPDPATGYQRTVYATCPTDGQPVSVRRVERGARGAIIQVTMRCTRCRRAFSPALEELRLR